MRTDLDFSTADEVSTVKVTGLQNVTELYATGSLLKNAITNENGLSIFINGIKIIESGQAIRVGKNTAAINSRMISKYNGIYWETICSNRTASDSLVTNSALIVNNVVASVGDATSLELRPTSTVVSGKLEVWAR